MIRALSPSYSDSLSTSLPSPSLSFATVCVLPFGKQEEMHFHICVPWLVKAGDLDAYHQYDEDHNGGNPLVTNPQLLSVLSKQWWDFDWWEYAG